jgi:hypothetical protein
MPPQATRATEVLRYVEQQNQLDELARIVQQVVIGGGPAPKRAAIDFTAEHVRHARFVGRDALLQRLDQLLIDEPIDRWVVVTGGPGMGKSALLSKWLARREAAGALAGSVRIEDAANSARGGRADRHGPSSAMSGGGRPARRSAAAEHRFDVAAFGVE